ncbi:MAG: right-handed parallel beta-helix repeat-containing protein [Candidatus Neomarinimicrobiota bacterium]
MQLVTPNHNQFDTSRMSLEYELMMRGIPSQTHAQAVGNQDADLWVATPIEGNSGGYTQSMGFGPYTIAPGDSIRIVLAEGVNGLSREKCEQIGGQWFQQNSPYTKPDGSVTSNRDEFKDAWVFTGKDSIRQTFNKALTVWQNGLNFEQLPPPPDLFEVISDSSQIVLNWSDNAESYTNFAGYRIYRSVGTNEGPYERIFECGKGSSVVNTYQDKTVEFQKDYYYYIASYDDGTVSTTSPGKVLESNLFWTRTDQPATLRSEPFIFGDVFISPNGDDGNSGLTPEQSFKTLANAINKIAGSKINRQTIHLSNGRYSVETTGETFPIIINKPVRIEGTPDNRAILDAQSSGGVISIASNVKVDLANLIIKNGNSQYGGGIKAGDFSSIFLSGVSIINNKADCGSGIYFGNSTRIKFDPNKLCNIYNNQYGRFGSEIFGIHPDSMTTVIVDTFTVRKPCDYLVYPCEMFSMDVRHSVIDQFTSDLYVAPEGDDSNIGTDSFAPLKTVRQAIIKSDPSAMKNIILSPGIYSPSTTGEVFPVRGFSNLTISGPDNLQAILDPEQLGNGIYIDNDSNLTIKNLEIRNGDGLYGGAVYIINSRPNLENLHLIGNRAFDGGGGIACFDQAAPILSNLTINNNQATYGGAIFFSGISEVKFDTSKLCNIYNNSAVFGSDLYAGNCSNPVSVYLDTFTVYYLTEDYVFPLTSFDMHVNTGLIPQIEADLYVNPLAGNDENDGISRETSFKTIRKALEMVFADKQRPHSLYLDAGVYSSATNGETFPLTAKSYVKILGDTIGETILDAANTSNVFVINGITDAELSNLQIINGKTENGGGIYCNASEMKLNNLIISGNSATNGAGLYIDNYSKIHVSRTEFTHNTATNTGAAIISYGSDLSCYRVLIDSNKCRSDAIFLMRNEFNIPEFSFINLTIANNTYSTNYGGIRYSGLQAKIIIINSILRSSSSNKINVPNKSNLVLVNSNIEGGLTGVKGSGTIRYSDQIVDFDPQFVGGASYDYHLSESSGCIDKGIAFFILDDDTLLNLADSEFQGNAPDLGAIESPYTSSIDRKISDIPDKFMLFPNYPNPFNSSTTIKYALSEDSRVEIAIYDINGRLVNKLVDEKQPYGYRTITWKGTNQWGQPVGSGFYIYTMKTPSIVLSRKLILIK